MIMKYTFLRKIPYGIYLVLLAILPYNSQAQSVKRQCISSYSTCSVNNDISIIQTAGQPYNTFSFNENKVTLLQGFQQPENFVAKPLGSVSSKNIDIIVYPTPCINYFTIKSKDLLEQSEICVTDLSGKSVFSEELNQLFSHNINCETWESGIYIITVRDKFQHKFLFKLMINK